MNAPLDSLLEDYFEATLAEENIVELLERLKSDPAAMIEAQERFDLHGLLQERQHHANPTADILTRVERAVCLDESPIEFEDRILDAVATTKHQKRRSTKWIWILALAATLIVVFLQRATRHRTPSTATLPSNAVATITNTTGILWHRGQRPSQTIREGESLTIDRGTLQLKGVNGVDYLLEGPAELVVNDPDSCLLRKGRLSIRVPGNAGFTVNTPHAKIIDLGTEFGVVTNGTSTEAHLFDGRLQLQSNMNSNHKEIIEQGQARRIDVGSPRLHTIPSNPQSFGSQPFDSPLTIVATGLLARNGTDQQWQVKPRDKDEWVAARVVQSTSNNIYADVLSNSESSRWITSPNGPFSDWTNFLFQTKFEGLATAATILLDIQHAADDRLIAIELNGHQIWSAPSDDRKKIYASTAQFMQLRLAADTIPGTNKLTFIIRNGDLGFPERRSSGMMFRAEIQARIQRNAAW